MIPERREAIVLEGIVKVGFHVKYHFTKHGNLDGILATQAVPSGLYELYTPDGSVAETSHKATPPGSGESLDLLFDNRAK